MHSIPGKNDPKAAERRRKARLSIPFVVKVQGVDLQGETFEIYTQVDNISQRGSYMRITRHLKPGANLVLTVHLPAAQHDQPRAGRVGVTGVVRRAHNLRDGRCGIGIEFTHHIFLADWESGRDVN